MMQEDLIWFFGFNLWRETYLYTWICLNTSITNTAHDSILQNIKLALTLKKMLFSCS